MRAGGFNKAMSEMKQFYRRKFESSDLHNDGAVMAMYLARTGPVPAPALFSDSEVEEVIFGMKRGKSAGPDGIVYEHSQVLMNSELKPHFVEFLNRILVGDLQLPESWFVSRVAFLATVAKPTTPKDLRPIVLSPVVCKWRAYFSAPFFLFLAPFCFSAGKKERKKRGDAYVERAGPQAPKGVPGCNTLKP